MTATEQPRTVSQVRDAVLDYLKRSGVAPGERIPTERKLQEILGVSRNRVRDALATLESQGTVKRLIGSGTYFQAPPEIGSEAPKGETGLNTISPSSLIEARLAFEVSLPPIVVRNATNDDLSRMEQVILESEQATTEEEFERLDAEFHHLIAVAAHNELLIQFSHVITEGRLATSWRHLKKRSYTPERRNGYQHDHRRILRAFQERSAGDATDAIREHLLAIHRALMSL